MQSYIGSHSQQTQAAVNSTRQTKNEPVWWHFIKSEAVFGLQADAEPVGLCTKLMSPLTFEARSETKYNLDVSVRESPHHEPRPAKVRLRYLQARECPATPLVKQNVATSRDRETSTAWTITELGPAPHPELQASHQSVVGPIGCNAVTGCYTFIKPCGRM